MFPSIPNLKFTVIFFLLAPRTSYHIHRARAHKASEIINIFSIVCLQYFIELMQISQYSRIVYNIGMTHSRFWLCQTKSMIDQKEVATVKRTFINDKFNTAVLFLTLI